MFELLRVTSVVLLPASAFAVGFLLTTLTVRRRRPTGSAEAFFLLVTAVLVWAGPLVEDPLVEPPWLQSLILVGGGLIAGVVGAMLFVAVGRWRHRLRRRRRLSMMRRGAVLGWRERWNAVVASDVGGRDGIGWEFTDAHRRGVWAVYRDDGGPFPVFSAARGDGDLPSHDDLEAMTVEAVADLLAAGGWADDHGWMTKNISAALLLASRDITGWEGEEWALESDEDDEPLAWASPGGDRTPFLWLRARGASSHTFISTYQDDFVFGLDFLGRSDRQLPESDTGSLRSRPDVPLPTGPLNKVEVVFDTAVEGTGVLSEVLLHGDTTSSMLIAAEAYSPTDWRLYDESVVVLPDATTADRLDWHPPRRKWVPTQSP